MTIDAEGNILMNSKNEINLQVGDNRISLSKEGLEIDIKNGNINVNSIAGSTTFLSNRAFLIDSNDFTVKSKTIVDVKALEINLN